jgi:hypothetical protein
LPSVRMVCSMHHKNSSSVSPFQAKVGICTKTVCHF